MNTHSDMKGNDMKRSTSVFVCQTFNGKHYLKPVIRRTQKGADAYANRMGYKYGEKCNVCVEEYGDRQNGTWGLIRTTGWSA